MAYIASYRRFRPKTFDEIVGQNQVTYILKNQIAMGKIAHAYLFSGTRGTGKTSAAKIFARAVNCSSSLNGEPCNTCNVCKNIDSSTIMDVIEIDAASNRGVDEIRDLREKVKYPPTLGKYKVYIIDEVHMLTQEAFNALLKTLEEPPKHIIFILATTEPHKLPSTILSRCQRYDFKRLSVTEIVDRLKNISEIMGVKIEEEALVLIAKSSDGAMRDALSIYDQCISINNGEIIEYNIVKGLLGITDEYIIINLMQGVINNDAEEVIKNLNDIYNSGKEIKQLLNQLIKGFRDLLITKISKNSNDLIDSSKDVLDRFNELTDSISKERLYSIIEYLTEIQNKINFSTQSRILMEVALIKLSHNESEESNILQKVSVPPKIIRDSKDIYAKETKKKNVEKKEEIKEEKKSYSTIVEKTDLDWGKIINIVKKEKPFIGTALGFGKIIQISNDKIILEFEENDSFHIDNINKNIKLIESIINKIYNKIITLECSIKKNSEIDFLNLTKELFDDDIIEIEN